jgi:hypothetical protein
MIDASRLDFVKTLRGAGLDHRMRHEVFRVFATASACAVAFGTREDEYLEAIKGWERPELDLIAKAFGQMVVAMDENPYTDVLGPAFMEVVGHNERSGEFYTPQSISRMMAMMVLPASAEEWDEDGSVLTAVEPCCGAGSMIMAARHVMADQGVSPQRLHWTAIDISRTAADMCYVNMTLYGIPGVVAHGDSLSMALYGAWRTPWRAMTRDEAPLVADSMHGKTKLLTDLLTGGNEDTNADTNAGEPRLALTPDEQQQIIERLVEGGIWASAKDGTKSSSSTGLKRHAEGTERGSSRTSARSARTQPTLW